jgi:hypothetical protein
VRHGQLQLKEVKVMSAGAGYPSLMVNANEPFTVRVTVDLESLERDGRSSLEYSASVVARLPGRQRRTVGEAQGKLEGSTGTEMIEVRSAGNGLDAGIYKLNIAIRFRDPATSQPIAFAALLEGQVLHVV